MKSDCFDITAGHSDSHCLKFTQLYDPEYYTGRYHSEVCLEHAAQHGQSAYYGFAFKIAVDWEFNSNYDDLYNRISIAQFISNFKDVDCGDTGHSKGAVPSTMVWIQNDELYTKLRSGDPCHDTYNIEEFKIGRVTPGEWHSVVIGAYWHKDKVGWFKVWYDQQLKLDKQFIKTFMDTDDRSFEFRVGLYPNWYNWNDEGHPFIKESGQRKKVIYMDKIGYGQTFSDADPHTLREGVGKGYKKIKTSDTLVSANSTTINNGVESIVTYVRLRSVPADCIGFGCS